MKFHVYWWIRGGILACFIASMFWLFAGISGVFPSPDERANAFFAQTFAEKLSFCSEEPLNVIAQGLVHPRSTVAPGTCILPSSFLGLPVFIGIVILVFGVFGSTVASIAAMCVTPFLAGLGIAAWWWTVRRLTGRESMADIAAFVVLIHPAFWYYSARVMMHNVPFASFLLIAGSIAILAIDRRSVWLASAAGAIAALAMTMRLVEAPIFIIVIAIALIFYRRSVPWKLVFFASGSVILVFGLYAALSAMIYGSPFVTGYTLPDLRAAADSADSIVAVAPSMFDRASGLLLPFGFHPRAMMKNVLTYGFQLYPMLSFLAIIGAVMAWRTKLLGWRLAVALLFITSVWMGMVYGSWSMADNIDPNAVTVGNSHVRYWLPLFVASSVFVAYAVDAFTRRSRAASMIVIVMLLCVGTLSAQTVFGGTDGLLATRSALISYEEKQERVFELVRCSEGGDLRPIVVVDHADKYLFPTCRVIVPLRSDATYAILPTLIDIVPIYYFGLTLPQGDVDFLNEEKLGENALRIDAIETIMDQTLYRISRVANE
ncbi:MAG: hypothetical protein WCT28_03085 [Patescibacteria group bacterium]|jgi:hypothetical protein